jgi:hypothetical protein
MAEAMTAETKLEMAARVMASSRMTEAQKLEACEKIFARPFSAWVAKVKVVDAPLGTIIESMASEFASIRTDQMRMMKIIQAVMMAIRPE